MDLLAAEVASGKIVGASLFTGYSANKRRGLSLATVDPDVEIGTEYLGGRRSNA